MKWLVRIGIGLGTLVALLALLVFGARFADGPLAILPGGPLASGEWVDDPDVDWSFAAEVEEIELESAGRSRTTWILVHEGEAYVPCSLSFPPGKSWHREALEDPAAVVRVDGRRYPRRLEKVENEALEAQLRDIVLAMYTPPPGDGGAWFFPLAPRAR
jgi:hypothetical protein